MTQAALVEYTVKYYNEKTKSWGVYHITYDMADAYNNHASLLNRGLKASITQSYVIEVED